MTWRALRETCRRGLIRVKSRRWGLFDRSEQALNLAVNPLGRAVNLQVGVADDPADGFP